MKTLTVIVVSITLLLMPSFVFSQKEQMTAGAPPIAQPLVREGDLAIKLVEKVKIGTAGSEAEAETILSSSGIAPKNGWISDYPVTPDIISELQVAIGSSADDGRLSVNKDEALRAFRDLTISLGLPIADDSPDSYTGGEPRNGYPDRTVVNNYYYMEGPPVVTYYPPPWDYYYLYTWVPWPFWYHGFHFHGFFVLHHFHRPIFLHKKVVVVSNRVFDSVTKKVFIVDPVKRLDGKTGIASFDKSGASRFKSIDDRRSAASIVERSRERTSGRGKGVSGSSFTSMDRGEGFVKQPDPGRPLNRGPSGTREGSSSGRIFSRQENMTPREEMNFQRPSVPSGRPSGGQGRGSERSFHPPSRESSGSGSGRSERIFNTPSRDRGSFNGPFSENRGFSGELRSGRSSDRSNSGRFEGEGRRSASQGASGNRSGGGCRGRC
jgi:hypothetical protein